MSFFVVDGNMSMVAQANVNMTNILHTRGSGPAEIQVHPKQKMLK